MTTDWTSEQYAEYYAMISKTFALLAQSEAMIEDHLQQNPQSPENE